MPPLIQQISQRVKTRWLIVFLRYALCNVIAALHFVGRLPIKALRMRLKSLLELLYNEVVVARLELLFDEVVVARLGVADDEFA